MRWLKEWTWGVVSRNRGHLLACGIIAVLPLTLSSYHQRLVVSVVVIAIAVMGLDLVVGGLGLFSFGQAGFAAIGAYGSVNLMTHAGLGFASAAILATVAAGALGAILALPAARLTGFSFALVTFTFAFVAANLAVGSVLFDYTNGEIGIAVIPRALWHMDISTGSGLYYLCLICFLFAALLRGNLLHSRAGRAMRTIKENELAAVTMGIPVGQYKVAVFALSSAYGGLSGVLLAQQVGYVTYLSFDVEHSILYVAMLILGGLLRSWGPLVGASFFVLLPQYLGGVASSAIIFSLVLLFALIVAPQGVMGLLEPMAQRLVTRVRPKRRIPPSLQARRESL
jgi:branched-chain amino acid transport system permease protein